MGQGIQETEGIVLYRKNYREKDLLVKIFTEKYGKIMFFVKNVKRVNHPLKLAVTPFTESLYIASIRPEGLSFLNDSKDTHVFKQLQLDIFLNAYATYLLNLVDVAIEDKRYDPALYGFLKQALTYLDEGQDPEVITNIFEVQLLDRFGYQFNWQQCGVCGKTTGVFDFSSKYHGILCQKHFSMDDRRYHANPRSIHFLRLFSQISLDQIQRIDLKDETKEMIRQTIDAIYEEYVGVHLKSKKFLDDMKKWENVLK